MMIENLPTRLCVAHFLFLLLACAVNAAQAQIPLPPDFQETPIAFPLNSPTTMAFAPDGRLFVCLQGGELRVIKNGVMLAAPFVTAPTIANDEEGLLGVTFDPDFETNQWVYVTYTSATPARHNVIARYTASGDSAAPGSEVTIFDLDHNVAHYHLGGALHFGHDGKLYTTTGDNANSSNSPSLQSTHGKILRLNKDGTIPEENPFFNTLADKYRAIWGFGFRNAFTFAMQPGTGRIFINDVGNSAWEEINEGIAGSNYGGRRRKGRRMIRQCAGRCTLTITTRAARLPAACFIIPRATSFRRSTSANISLQSIV